jgi:tRNA (guanine37-N1)-methyltransferase
MLIRPEPVFNGLNAILKQSPFEKRDLSKTRVIMMSARGEKFNQAKAEELAKLENIVILAGHYEGFDQRIGDNMVDEEISVGEYVLTGGELPAMIIVDAVTRLLPGVLGKDASSHDESWSEIEIGDKKIRTKEYPQYTRPQDFMGHKVPEILVSGDQRKIKEWQLEKRTAE